MTTTTNERADLLQALTTHRGFLRTTVQGLSDEQASQHTTVSALCLGGLIKHVAEVESRWADFILRGAPAMAGPTGANDWASRFQMEPGETLDQLVEHYEQVAQRTDDLLATLPDLDASHRLPDAPWFEPGASWSARRVLLHIIGETAQHAGHADILRESLDGAKTMG